MERITSHQVVGLMEAYTAVHTPQINEEQVWEEVETWVNSLVEEGHDLSEYTWEEMYEEYITEIGVNFGGQKAVDKVRSNMAAERQSNSRLDAARAQRFGGVNPVVKAAKGGVQGTLDKTSGKWTATKTAPAVRPAAPAPTARPGAPAPTARPGAPAPTARPGAPAPTARPGAPAPTAARPAPAPAGGAQRPIPSGTTVPVRPATPATAPARNGFGAPTAPMAAQSSVSSATAPAPASRPSLASQSAELRAMQAASRQRQGLTQSFDVFDVIKGHLIDEGYADTEEAALQIMANMSEEWRESIVEEVLDEAKVDKYLDNKLKKSNVGDDETGRSIRKDIKISQRRKRASVTPDTPRQRRLSQKLRDNRDRNNEDRRNSSSNDTWSDHDYGGRGRESPTYD